MLDMTAVVIYEIRGNEVSVERVKTGLLGA